MISRIKRGELDEYKKSSDDQSFIEPYMENYNLLESASTAWDGDARLDIKVGKNITGAGDEKTFNTDLEPDEFVFNFNGFSGSFMLNSQGKWIIRGNNAAEFEVRSVNM